MEYQEGFFPYQDQSYFKKYENQPCKYKLRDGCESDDFLEEIIKDRRDAYSHLVWHNQYFGQLRKKAIKNKVHRFLGLNPTLAMYPEAFDVLKNFVDFSQKTKFFLVKNESN